MAQVGALTLVCLMAACGVGAKRAAAPGIAAVPLSQQAAILEATVRITLIAPCGQGADEHPAPCINNRLGYDGGLGTAVLVGRRRLIITHDHWSLLTPDLLRVRITAHDGRPLAYLSGFAFHNSIRYRDGATLVFRAPESVPAGAMLAAEHAFEPGDPLLVVRRRRDGGRLEVVRARVSAVDGGTPAKLHLRLPQGQTVACGSSGGGIWSGDKLVGNLWYAVYTDSLAFAQGDAAHVQRSVPRESVGALLPRNQQGAPWPTRGSNPQT